MLLEVQETSVTQVLSTLSNANSFLLMVIIPDLPPICPLGTYLASVGCE